MSLQQGSQPKSVVNGFGRRRADRETGAKSENKMHFAKSASSSFSNRVNGGRTGGVATPSHDRLIYVMSYLLGLPVEVHVRDGSVISGIFHSANEEKDFAIVLKMAQVIKDGSLKGQKQFTDIVKKPVDMIIQARDFVQIVAEDVPLNMKEFSNGHSRDKRKDLMIDSAISHSHHGEVQRELARWTPDADDPECPELEDIFDGTWNRKWDQFETNETLFGVKSTFDEELYTTKLERGPQMRELEREATRMAREIEGEDTRDLHLAEERGIQFDEDFDLDEEIKYSAVQRGIDDQTFGESHSSCLDAYSTESFIRSDDSAIPILYSDISRSKFSDEAQASSTSLSADVEASTQIHIDKDAHQACSSNHGMPAFSDRSRLDEKQTVTLDDEKGVLDEGKERRAPEKAQTSPSEDVQSTTDAKGPSAMVTVVTSSTDQDNKHSEVLTSARGESAKPSPRSGTSASSTSACIAAGSLSSVRSLSPSSSLGSLSSEKSTLNPNAKEFKLNPNAKSFTPTASSRPPVPIPDSSFYYPTSNPSGVPAMRGVPMGIGVGQPFGTHQPVFNSQSAPLQSPQAYIHPNGQLYGQHMIVGQPRPVYYMPTYPPEMPYRGRNF